MTREDGAICAEDAATRQACAHVRQRRGNTRQGRSHMCHGRGHESRRSHMRQGRGPAVHCNARSHLAESQYIWSQREKTIQNQSSHHTATLLGPVLGCIQVDLARKHSARCVCVCIPKIELLTRSLKLTCCCACPNCCPTFEHLQSALARDVERAVELLRLRHLAQLRHLSTRGIFEKIDSPTER